MTLLKTLFAAGVSAAVLATAMAPAQAQSSAGRMWTGSHGHHRYHSRPYNYHSRHDTHHQTRSGGPVGGLRDRN